MSKFRAESWARRAARFGVLLALALGVVPARAQNNSLLRRGAAPPPAQGVATSQPAAVVAASAAGLAAPPNVRPPQQPGTPGEPLPNPVLLAASPFAVEAPAPRTIEVNSLITIIIHESRTSLNDAKMKSEKDWEMQAALSKWFRLDQDDHLVAQNLEDKPGVDWTFENSYEGKGKYDRKDELSTRLTARVIDVKPNGNLVLEARKRIKTGDEILLATLTGECRSDDVTAANTVLSTQVADLQIEMPDVGAVRDATTRGWLMKAFDFLKPI